MKKLLIALIIILLIVATIVSVGFWFINHKLSKLNYVSIPLEEIEITEGIEENLDEYRNVVLYGVDTITDTFEGRSDCIIIASINQKTKEIKLVSVYRDTYLEVPEHNRKYDLDKVTHAYIFGGPGYAMSVLNRNMDLDIKEFVTVNFESVKKVVDAIGGVQITVTQSEAKNISGISTAGTYNLNGEQALTYARIRKIDSDYKRTERMRTVLTAVFEKAKTLGLLELNSLLNELLPEASTNIEKKSILSLLPTIYSYKVVSSIGWPYNTTGKTINGVWYGPPVTLESNVSQLHEELFEEEAYQPSETVKEISNKIIKITGYK